MTKRKPKAIRVTKGLSGTWHEADPDNIGLRNGTLYPDGASPPRDRKRERVVRAAMRLKERKGYIWDSARSRDQWLELEAALAALGRGTK